MSREFKFRAWNTADCPFVGMANTMTGPDNISVDGCLYNMANDRDSTTILMQYTGLKDKNGSEIYEGDILRWYSIDIEYQTHHGDNIPSGSYTEPCGTICKKFEMPVIFRDAMFTCSLPVDPEEDDQGSIYCPIQWPTPYDRKELNNIFWPRPYHKQSEVLSDEEFLEVAKSCAEELGFECSSIDEFIHKLNGFEVIGNIHENK